MTPSGLPELAKCHACNGDRHYLRVTGRSWRRDDPPVPAWSTVREYACLRCGHVGWSAHPQLARVDELTIEDEQKRRRVEKVYE